MAPLSLHGLLKSIFPTNSPGLQKHAVLSSTRLPSIVLPLYIYPDPNAWDPIFASIGKHPEVPFIIIINPSSGPGTTKFPDKEYISGIRTLNSFPNVKLVGYVPLDYGKRDIVAVKKDIDIYVGWGEYQDEEESDDVKIGLGGIFFDESPCVYEKISFTYLEAVARYSRRTLAFSSEIVLNPGTVTDERICSLVDGVVEFEDFHKEFSEKRIRELETTLPRKNGRKAIAVVHHLQGGVEEMKRVVDQCMDCGMDGFFVNDKEYDEVGQLWEEFCGIIAAIRR
jgi:hypothetical protein